MAHILISEDHCDTRDLIDLILTADGHMVVSAPDAAHSVLLAAYDQPDLIVMDLSMPVLDGWGVLQELKADQRTLAIPCMAVTAHAELSQSEALATGFLAYVSKPFSSDFLLKTIATVLAETKAVHSS